MSNEGAVVQNLADPQQVKAGENRAKFLKRQELDDLRNVLDSRQGRRLLWRILEKCKVFETIFHQSSLIYYQSGQQDLGHWLMGEITDADEGKLFDMMREAKQT